MATAVSGEELALVVEILSRVTVKDVENPGLEPLSLRVYELWGRRWRKEIFGDKDAVQFLKEQSEHKQLLRKLKRCAEFVDFAHLQNVDENRACGINSMREARTHEVNSSGLLSLTAQEAIATLVHDNPQHLLLQSPPLSSPSSPSANEYSRAGGHGRSRGRKAAYSTQRIRGMYEDDGEEEEGEEGEVKSLRRNGTLFLVPRPGVSKDANAAVHAGLFLSYVQDNETQDRRACAHRTVIDVAYHCEAQGSPLDARTAETIMLPCTYLAGKRKQRWALLGGEVDGMSGETAVSVRLSAGANFASALLTDGQAQASSPSPDSSFVPKVGGFCRHCNVCKSAYTSLHKFYHQLCPRCGDFNLAKRLQSCDLKGYNCVVTGGRVRIGLQIALKLLRAGANVVVTSRFCNDAATRFSLEADYAAWSDRLTIENVELTDIRGVELFCDYLHSKFDRLHILINNAAQTITRSDEWKTRMCRLERGAANMLPAPAARPLLTDWNASRPSLLLLQGGDATGGEEGEEEGEEGEEEGRGGEGALATKQKAGAYKAERLDESGQPVDASGTNSWSRRLHEVSTSELTQTMAANAIAPFLLCSRLKELLRPKAQGDKKGHIVNVSSLEGKMNCGKKSSRHPHTNSAKAALNMLTLTSGRDYASDGVYMNAVDTGWITDMAPLNQGASSKTHESFTGPPLDEVDGAARVLDPIFSHVLHGSKVSGAFLKDYHLASW